ncbi:MAG: rhodanese-like domain-containing protein [Acidimicrobiales bacterium]
MALVHPEYLVTTQWLADHLDDPDVVVLDVTARLTSSLDNAPGLQCWIDQHIPGSVFFDVASAKGRLSNPDASLPWMWPTADQFGATMADIGVGPHTKVVLVGRTPRPGVDSGTMWCTRAWWTMHHFGVDCAILHGGIERWQAEGRPMAHGEDQPAARPVPTPAEPSGEWQRARATKDDVLAAVQAIGSGDASVCIVDALSANNYGGSSDVYGGRAGHIEGAINVPYASLIEAETCGFVDAVTMRAVLADAGLLDAPRVITYCGGAIAATVDAFCLALLGHQDVAVYDGSLMEWAADPNMPMVNPSA